MKEQIVKVTTYSTRTRAYRDNAYIIKAIGRSAPNIPVGYQEAYLNDEL